MRFCGRLKNLCLLVFCVCLSIVYFIFKSNKVSIDFNETLITDQSFDSLNINQIDVKSSETPKWKVTSDGTVIHQGNFTDQSFRRLSFLINEVNICEHFSENTSKLLIIIESEAINFERREAIRETWAQQSLQKSLNFIIVFLLGLHHNEHQRLEIQVSFGAK